MPKPPPAVNTGNTVRCEVSLANIVVVMEQPLSSEAQRLAGDQRLAAQDAVLIRKRQPDHFELLLLDDAAQPARRLLLLARPQTVTLDETQCVTPWSRVARSRSDEAIQTPLAQAWSFASLAVTKHGRSDHHSAADRCCTLPAISSGTGAAHGAPRRRLTSTSIQ